MAVLSRDRIVDNGQSLQGRRGRVGPIAYAVFAILEFAFGITLLFEGSAWGVLNLLMCALAAGIAVSFAAPAVVDDCGVRPMGHFRRVPWTEITKVDRPNSKEGSVVVVLESRRRVQTGFPRDLLPRIAALGGKAQIDS